MKTPKGLEIGTKLETFSLIDVYNCITLQQNRFVGSVAHDYAFRLHDKSISKMHFSTTSSALFILTSGKIIESNKSNLSGRMKTLD